MPVASATDPSRFCFFICGADLEKRGLRTSRGALSARNAGRLNFGFMENIVIKLKPFLGAVSRTLIAIWG